MKRVFGFILIMWAAAFATLETRYFGHNWTPQSNEEIVCDLTALLLMIAGHILLWQKQINAAKDNPTNK